MLEHPVFKTYEPAGVFDLAFSDILSLLDRTRSGSSPSLRRKNDFALCRKRNVGTD